MRHISLIFNKEFCEIEISGSKNNKTGIDFVSEWIKNIEESSLLSAKESPMLGKTVDESLTEDIEFIDRVAVSCYNIKEYKEHNQTPFIIHFKGGSLSNVVGEDQKKRIYGSHGFDKEIKKYLDDV